MDDPSFDYLERTAEVHRSRVPSFRMILPVMVLIVVVAVIAALVLGGIIQGTEPREGAERAPTTESTIQIAP